jgi:hypothetical protein
MTILLNSRLVYFVLTLAISSPCLAKWKKLEEGDGYIKYYDIDTVKKIDGIIHIWSMKDFKKPQQNGNLSTKYYSKYDCNLKRYKILSIIEYNTNMGRGRKFTYKKNISNEVEESDWVYTKPNGEEYDSLRLLCNK